MLRMDTLSTTPRERLRAWASERTWTQGRLADALGVTQQAVSSILAGRVTPSTAVAHCIAALTGIPTEDWLGDADRAAVERARAARKPSEVAA